MCPNSFETRDNATWLRDFIISACEKEWCFDIGCTTCGARDFRQGLQKLIDKQTSGTGRTEQIAQQLRLLSADDAYRYRHMTDALEMLFHSLDQPIIWGGCPDLPQHLTGSWVGQQQETYFMRQRKRAERISAYNKLHSPAAIELRKEEKEEAKKKRILDDDARNKNGKQRRPERFNKWLGIKNIIPPQGAVPINPQLAAAFSQAHFEVAGIVLKPGSYNQALNQLLARKNAKEAVFITAYNPRGQQVAAHVNRQLQRRLTEIAREHGPFMRGWGGSADGSWPKEPSLLILGMGISAGRELAAQFGQAALLYMSGGHVRLMATQESEQAILDEANGQPTGLPPTAAPPPILEAETARQKWIQELRAAGYTVRDTRGQPHLNELVASFPIPRRRPIPQAKEPPEPNDKK